MVSRSPNYPACALERALGMTKNVWENEGRTPVSAEVAATAIGYKGLSGASRTMLAAMKKYGLITDDRSGSRVSDLGLQILHPASTGELQRALREAALRPDLFRS